jgi:hypothetical protein
MSIPGAGRLGFASAASLRPEAGLNVAKVIMHERGCGGSGSL